MVLWWIGNAILLLVVLPVVIFLLNRVLAAVERIRGAADDVLAGGVALIGELNGSAGGAGRHRHDHQGSLGRRGQVRRLRRQAPRLSGTH